MTGNISKLYIKKRSVPEWLCYAVVVLPLLLAFFIDFLGITNLLKYGIDAVLVVVLAFCLTQKKQFLNKSISPLVIIVGIFLIYTLIFNLFNFQSPFYYFWGLRNNFRFYLAFIVFVLFFDEQDLFSLTKIFDVLFWVNAVVSLYQFFVLGYQQDYLGGLFGVERGCNAHSMIFFGIVVSKSLLSFLKKEEKIIACVAKCGTSLLIAALAELKFYYVVFIFILIMSIMLTRFSWRKLIILIAGVVLSYFLGMLLPLIFGDSSTLTFEGIVKLMTSSTYSTAEDLGRFTAIPTISDTFLKDIPSKLFGMGLGNCDTSSFAIFNTPFFENYSYLHYSWFSSAFLFLETGYVGLALYFSFFICCFVLAYRLKKKGEVNEVYCQMSMIMSLLCIILTFYNASLRTEAGYMAYFALSLPFVQSYVNSSK